jgi:flagellar biosynthesis/type III secretory pathway protein FliH
VLEPDPAMLRGDVHVTTPQGLLVRELEPALDAVREQLLEDLS